MKKISQSLVLSSFFLLVACSPSNDFETLHVSSDTSEQEKLLALQKIYSVETVQTDHVDVQNSKIEWKRQIYGGLPILNSWIKTVSTEQNKNDLVGAKIVLTPSGKISKSPLQDQISAESEIYKKIATRLKGFKIESVRTYWLERNKKLISVYEVLGISKNHQLMAVHLDTKGLRKVNQTPVGSHFSQLSENEIVDLKAFVFPDGPRRSPLTEVELTQVLKGITLNSKKINVYSSSGENVSIGSNPLHFDVGDPRFNQVQAFFILQKANDWFEKNLGWTWAGQLAVETEIGYPDQTNAMFYYQNKIRLGKGDGVLYKNIPQDPSIVVHEGVHSIVDRIARLPFQGEGGSLNEAYSDFIAAAYLDRPQIGDAAYLKGQFKRDISIPKSWSERSGGLYGDSLIVSSFFWELTQEIGKDSTLKLAIHTLRKLFPDETLDRFKEKLLASSRQTLNKEELTKFESLLKTRGWN